ncbi:MAG: hypothetical protein H7A12_04225 [Pseudomonadales bacterium]|jgi:hypothetical protein|nr:hypothetical protein [Pseudomonadales bacterium]MCP5320018.1 hypothetical protein [Pseudomonadales bacterium]MCP5338235.1 hypothetical protein [Pseudomonadales bacterium]
MKRFEGQVALVSGGNVVNAASTSALAGLPWGGAYPASRGATRSRLQVRSER